MNHPLENPQSLGAFEAHEAKGLLATLEKNAVPFELEIDDTAQVRFERTAQLIFGIYPEGTKFIVYVAEADLARARALLAPPQA